MRSRHPSHILLVSAGLLAVTGCSRQESEAPETSRDAAAPSQAVEAAADRAVPVQPPRAEVPGIDPGSAPGVAFAYRYAFTLPAEAIAGVQRQHAAACERLGPTRCQVAGMSYEQPRKGEVSARLDLMLAPDAAHGFGSDAIAAVEKAKGELENASVNGDSAGRTIEDSQRRSAALHAQLARIEQRLASSGLSKEEKLQLSRRAEELREALGNEQRVRQDNEAALALTPMSLAYGTEGMFSAHDPFGKAASSSFDSLQAMLVFLLTAAGLLLPWLLLGALAVLLLRIRAMKRRLAETTGGAADPAPSP